jgi:hypothetical protein
MNDIELSSVHRDPWHNFPALKALMRERTDWDTNKPMVCIDISHCVEKSKTPCEPKGRISVSPKDVAAGEVFDTFNDLWNEVDSPLILKKEQLAQAYWDSKVPNVLNQTWE